MLEPELLEEEVSGSRQLLSEILGEEVAGFCYPYGAIDGGSVRAVRRAQYLYACAYDTRVNWDMFDLPRIYVGNDTLPRFATKLVIYPEYKKVKGLLRTVRGQLSTSSWSQDDVKR